MSVRELWKMDFKDKEKLRKKMILKNKLFVETEKFEATRRLILQTKIDSFKFNAQN